LSRVASESGSDRSRSGEQSEIKTFLITDIRGYTRFSQEHGDAAAARLTGHFAEIVGEAVEAHGGEVVELRGDEVLAVFRSARSAIRAAVELQEVLGDEADDTLPIYAGVGLDAGEAVVVGDGYRGRALNLAARLCARAVAGEVLASGQAVHLAGAVDGVAFRSLGPVEVKGVERPVEVVSVTPLAAGSQRLVPAATAVAGELPVELDAAVPLIGRERELRRLRWLWRRARHDGSAMCLVWGVTGIGKTRLVAELVSEVARSGWRVSYVAGATAHEAAAEMLVETRLAGEPTLLIVDDLDACDAAVLARIEAITDGSPVLPLMLVATSRTASTRGGRRILESGIHERIELRPLGDREAAEVAALYVSGGHETRVPTEVLKEAHGVPALVHRLASEWANASATDRIKEAVSAAADGRPKLAVAEADIASRVTDLEWARERSRLFGASDDRSGGICPFKGLAPFGPEDAEYFFGRERLVAELTARVVGASFLGVVGPSGSGKSSAVRAGLVPALASGVLPGSDQWPLVVMRPGEDPNGALAEASAGLTTARGVRGVLVVDQFEETFTVCQDEAERRRFVAALSELARDPSMLIVVAVRADYVGRCADYPQLARLFGENAVLVGPMDADEFSRAIDLPAHRAGLSVEPELRDALVADVVDQPGALPLLSTKLLELWQLREGRTLTLSRYRETGGVRAAVAGLAESAYGKLSAEQQLLARHILLRLAIVDGEGSVVRRRARLDEFEAAGNPDAEQVLRVLTDARLLTTSDGYVEVAHEALLREWPRLRDWLREDAEGTQLHHHLIQAAQDWNQRGRDLGELYRGARLSAALDWTASHDPALNQTEREFLAMSRGAHQRELRRLRLLLAGAAVLLAAALVAGVVAYVQRGSAQRAATAADAQRLGAEAQLQQHLDLALLLARAGVSLDNSPATQSNLLATLVRSPAALVVRHIRGGLWAPALLALSPDGKTLAVANNQGQVVFLNARTLDPERSIVPPGGFGPAHSTSAIAYSPNGSLLAVAGGNPGTITLLDARSNALRGHLLHVPNAAFIVALSFSPDGRTLAAGVARSASGGCGGGSYWVTRFDVASGRQLPPDLDITRAYPCVDSIDKLFYSPSGDQLLATERAAGKAGLGRIVALRAADLSVEHVYPVTGVIAAALNPSETRLAVSTDTGSLTFMSYPSGKTLRTDPNSGGAWSMRYTPDGRWLITTSDDHTAKVWDARTGRIVQTLTGHTDTVAGLAISRNGQTLYTGGPDGTVIESDIGGRVSPLRRTLAFSPAYPAIIYANPQATGLAVSRNGELLAASPGPGVAGVWNLHTLQPVGPMLRGFRELDNPVWAPRGAQDLAFSPNGRLLAAGGTNGSPVVVWDDRTGQVVARLRQPTSASRCASGTACPTGGGLAFSPHGETLASGDTPNGVLLWNLSNGTSTKIPTNGPVEDLAYGHDANHLILATANHTMTAAQAMVWDIQRRRQIASFRVDEGPWFGLTGVAVSPDRGVLAYGTNNTIVLRSTSTGEPIGRPIPMASGYQRVIAVSPNGGTVALIAGDGVELWDTRTGSQIGASLPGAPTQPNNPGGPGNLAFTPNGHRLIIISPTGLITLWNPSPAAWDAQACRVAGRDITHAEWNKYVPGRSYRPVCPQTPHA
jgi:WD40 repeat protein/class 3 adenylate cyclase